MTAALDMIRGRSNIVTMTNNSGGGLVAGDVCIQDTSADENVTTTTSSASVLKVFIAAETIASGAAGKFYESGYCPLVNVNASVTRGRFLFTHTVARQAAENATYGAGAFGKILKSGTTPSAIIYSATAQAAGAGTIGGATGSTDNAVIRADGTGGVTIQSSLATIDDSGGINIPTGQTYNVNGSPHTHAGGGWPYPADGRLTLESGVPVSTADQANKTTLYYTFYRGNQIGLYDGAAWNVRTFTEISLAVGAFTASKPYDIWIYDNSGTPALDSTVWTNATTRATALAYQDGVLVKSGAATRRYVGTIYIDSGQKVQDTAGFRHVSNFYNQVPRTMRYYDATASWTYTTAAYRIQNNNAAFLVSFVCCVPESYVRVENSLDMSGGTAYATQGLDRTNNLDGTQVATSLASAMRLVSVYQGLPGIGYHYVAALEYVGSGTGTYYGNTASGLFGTVSI